MAWPIRVVSDFGHTSFDERVRNVWSELVLGLESSDLPFAEIANLAPSSDFPLVQFLFTLQKTLPEISLDGH